MLLKNLPIVAYIHKLNFKNQNSLMFYSVTAIILNQKDCKYLHHIEYAQAHSRVAMTHQQSWHEVTHGGIQLLVFCLHVVVVRWKWNWQQTSEVSKYAEDAANYWCWAWETSKPQYKKLYDNAPTSMKITPTSIFQFISLSTSCFPCFPFHFIIVCHSEYIICTDIFVMFLPLIVSLTSKCMSGEFW